jgi:hypothetical protein
MKKCIEKVFDGTYKSIKSTTPKNFKRVKKQRNNSKLKSVKKTN